MLYYISLQDITGCGKQCPAFSAHYRQCHSRQKPRGKNCLDHLRSALSSRASLADRSLSLKVILYYRKNEYAKRTQSELTGVAEKNPVVASKWTYCNLKRTFSIIPVRQKYGNTTDTAQGSSQSADGSFGLQRRRRGTSTLPKLTVQFLILSLHVIY